LVDIAGTAVDGDYVVITVAGYGIGVKPASTSSSTRGWILSDAYLSFQGLGDLLYKSFTAELNILVVSNCCRSGVDIPHKIWAAIVHAFKGIFGLKQAPKEAEDSERTLLLDRGNVSGPRIAHIAGCDAYTLLPDDTVFAKALKSAVEAPGPDPSFRAFYGVLKSYVKNGHPRPLIVPLPAPGTFEQDGPFRVV
jgi:hypothetical protein